MQQFNLKRELINPPASQPVSLAEMRAQIWNISPERATDEYLSHLISAATDYVETVTWRKIVDQTWRLYLDTWPQKAILLPGGKISSVDQVSINQDPERILGEDEYLVELLGESPGIYEPEIGWPQDTLPEKNGIKIEYACGWSVNNVPAGIKHAILLLGEHWHQHASPVIVGASVEEVPLSVDALLSPWMHSL